MMKLKVILISLKFNDKYKNSDIGIIHFSHNCREMNKTVDLVAKGFDRDVDYGTMKDKLVEQFNKEIDNLNELDENDKTYKTKRKKIIRKLIYLLVAMIQLRNGSRISEACDALRNFIEEDDTNEKTIVKIAKSESTKYKKDTKEKYKTKKRFRKMMFPSKWIDYDIMPMIKKSKSAIQWSKDDRLKKRVLDFLLLNFKCNTHSLRYAFINYMLYDLKRPNEDVAKFVGHVNTSMLVRYTQLKNTDQIFDLDI